MSQRGPPVCMSSIPQQARPNRRYQIEDFRFQLMRLSSFETRTIPSSPAIMLLSMRLQLSSHRGSLFVGLDPLDPLEIAFLPDIGEARKEDDDEDQELHECDQADVRFRPGPEHDRHGEG